jgi:hypothetical protein
VNLEQGEIAKMAKKIDEHGGDELAILFLILLGNEHDARHQKKPQLISKFTKIIDEERSRSG